MTNKPSPPTNREEAEIERKGNQEMNEWTQARTDAADELLFHGPDAPASGLRPSDAGLAGQWQPWAGIDDSHPPGVEEQTLVDVRLSGPLSEFSDWPGLSEVTVRADALGWDRDTCEPWITEWRLHCPAESGAGVGGAADEGTLPPDEPQTDWKDRAEKLKAALDWFSDQTHLSLAYDWPDEGDPGAWQVHACHGGVNDREWTLIAQAETAIEAIIAARQALSQDGK